MIKLSDYVLTTGAARLKKIVSAGDRVYLKYFDLSYFHERAREADATFVPFKSFDEDLFVTEIADADALVVIDRPIRAEHIAAMDRCRTHNTARLPSIVTSARMPG